MQKIVQIGLSAWQTLTPGVPGDTKLLNLEVGPRAVWPEVDPTGSAILLTWGAPASAAVSGSSIRPFFQLLAAAPLRVPAAELRSRYAELIEWSQEARRPIVVTNHGKPEAVILSFPVFERLVKGLARLMQGAGRRHLVDRTEEVIEAESVALNRRLRQRGSPRT